MEKMYAKPDYFDKDDVKRIRSKLNMSQKEFALFIGSSKATIERLETSKDKITGPIVFLLFMIENNLKYLESLQIPSKKYPIRLYYMYKNKICTLIDVDDNNQLVNIINYENNIMFRAFGNNENPTYKDYLDFLRSRCFPETRDKLKLVLRDLNIPFYDPFLIVKKTEGRMAEDDFWIKMEE